MSISFDNQLVHGPSPAPPQHRKAYRIAKPAPQKVRIGVLDSAATTTCGPSSFRGLNHQPVAPEDAIVIKCADQEAIVSDSTDTLPLQRLVEVAPSAAHMDKFQEMDETLISIPECDKSGLCSLSWNGTYKVILPDDPDNVTIPGEIIVEGVMNPNDGMYEVLGDVDDFPSAPATVTHLGLQAQQKDPDTLAVSTVLTCHDHPAGDS